MVTMKQNVTNTSNIDVTLKVTIFLQVIVVNLLTKIIVVYFITNDKSINNIHRHNNKVLEKLSPLKLCIMPITQKTDYLLMRYIKI